MNSSANERASGAYVLAVSLVAALGGLLFGYDTAVISGAIGPLFSLNAGWEGWTASLALLGCVIGAAVAGTLSDAIGRRKALVLAVVLFLVSALGRMRIDCRIGPRQLSVVGNQARRNSMRSNTCEANCRLIG